MHARRVLHQSLGSGALSQGRRLSVTRSAVSRKRGLFTLWNEEKLPIFRGEIAVKGILSGVAQDGVLRYFCDHKSADLIGGDVGIAIVVRRAAQPFQESAGENAVISRPPSSTCSFGLPAASTLRARAATSALMAL